MSHYTRESVPKKDERKRLEFVAQVPLWAIYSAVQNLDRPIEQIVLCGGCTEETRSVSIYLRAA